MLSRRRFYDDCPTRLVRFLGKHEFLLRLDGTLPAVHLSIVEFPRLERTVLGRFDNFIISALLPSDSLFGLASTHQPLMYTYFNLPLKNVMM